MAKSIAESIGGVFGTDNPEDYVPHTTVPETKFEDALARIRSMGGPTTSYGLNSLGMYGESTLPPEQQQLANDMAQSMAALTEATSASTSALMGFDSSYNFTESMAIAAQAGFENFSHLADEWGFDGAADVLSNINWALSHKLNFRALIDGGTNGGFIVAPETAVGMSWDAWRDMDYSGRTAAIHEEKAKLIEEYYTNPYTQTDNPMAYFGGEMGGIISDPTLGLPAAPIYRAGQLMSKGQAIVAGGATGSVVGALDGIAWNLAEVEGADWTDIAYGALFGGVLGTGIGYLARSFAKSSIEKGMRAKEADIRLKQNELRQQYEAWNELLSDPAIVAGKSADEVAALRANLQSKITDLQSNTAEEIASAINIAYKLGDETEMASLMNDIFNTGMTGIQKNDEMVTHFLNRMSGKEGLLPRIKDSVAYKKMTPEQKKFADKAIKRYTQSAEEFATVGAKAAKQAAIEEVEMAQKSLEKSLQGVEPALRKAEKSYANQVKDFKKAQRQQRYEFEQAFNQKKRDDIRTLRTEIEKTKLEMHNATPEQKKVLKEYIDAYRQDIQKIKTRPMPKMREQKPPPPPEKLAKLREYSARMAEGKIADMAEAEIEDLLSILGKMSDNGKANIRKNMGAPSAIKNANGAEDQIRRQVQDGDIQATSPVGQKLYDDVGTLSESLAAEAGDQAAKLSWTQRMGKKFNSSMWISKPGEYFKNAGNGGRIFAAKMERADQMWREMSGAAHASVMKTFTGLGLKMKGTDGVIVKGLMNKTIDDTDLRVTPAHREAARQVRELTESILRSSSDVGVLSKEVVNDLIAKGRKDGYFPRVYDTNYLRSGAGKRAFAKTIENMSLRSQADAEMVIAHLTNGDKAQIESFLQFMKKQPDGTYKFTGDGARRLAEGRAGVIEARRSHHLEMERKFPEYLEPDLEPYMINDFAQNLETYFGDTAKRLAYAKEFGANDEILDTLAVIAQRENPGEKIGERMRESLFLAVGDPRSEYLQKFQKMGDANRKFRTGLDTFANSKLMLAQILNMGQPIINGTVRLAATGENPISAFGKSLAATLKAYSTRTGKSGDIWAGDMVDIAERFGASIESASMRLLGDAVTANNGVHKATGGAGFMRAYGLDTWSHRMLKYSGFQEVERMNRVIGFELGKSHIESLIAKKQKLLAKQGTRGLSKGGQETLAKIDEHLVELGLDPTVDPSKYTMKNLDNGANVYSDVLSEGVADIDAKNVLNSNVSIGRAATKFTNDINFINTPLTKPLSWNSPNAKIFLKFKNFAMHQANFVYHNAYKPATKGNFGPLAGYMAFGSGVGFTIGEVRSLIRNDEPEGELSQRVMLGWMNAGGLGIASDFVRQSVRSREGMIDFLAGPIVSDAMDATRVLHDAGITSTEKDFAPEKLTQFATKSFGPSKLAVDLASHATEIPEFLKKDS